MIRDSSAAAAIWMWQPQTKLAEIFDEVAGHAQAHENWLELSADFYDLILEMSGGGHTFQNLIQ